MSKNLNIDMLGNIPIEIKIREGADTGKPYIEFFGDNNISNEIMNIAKRITEKIK